MPTWRADYFDNRDDEKPSHSEIIEARDADEVSMKAAARPGEWVKIDLTLTVLKQSVLHWNRTIFQTQISSEVPTGRSRQGGPLSDE